MIGPLSVRHDNVSTTTTRGTTTPTYLSQESLTFAGSTVVGTAAAGLWAAWSGEPITVRNVVVLAGTLGAVLTLVGLFFDEGSKGRSPRQVFGQLVVGLFNTVLLAATLWGAIEVAKVGFSEG